MKRLFCALLIISMFSSYSIFAQMKGESPIEQEQNLMQEFQKSISSQSTQQLQSLPLGNSIDPAFYRIGPSDILSLSIYPINPYPLIITVTPSVSIVIPRFGEINLYGKTLQQAQDSIDKFLQSRNPELKATLTLLKARNCLINIKGNMIFPTIYTVPASFQISTAINYANKVDAQTIPAAQYSSITKYNEQIRESERIFNQSKFSPISYYFTRNIVLLHNDGTSQNVDIEKSKALDNPEYNPYIREGDEIIVPYEVDHYPTISIAGEVNRPITLPYKENDSLSLLLKFGYGFTPEADFSNILLYQDGETKRLEFNAKGEYIGADMPLESGCVLVVGKKTAKPQKTVATVSVQGEVNHPGVYVINDEKTTLTEIVDLAGGFTPKAHLPLARIYRFASTIEYVMDPRRKINETFQYSNLTLEDTTRFMLDMDYPKNVVSCDFVEIFTNNNKNLNPRLQNGDIIYVPSQPSQVYVFGQVVNPGYIDYVPNKSMEYYIAKAGGYANGAQKSRARIIRGRNLIWVESNDQTFVYAGDNVYVPREPDIPMALQIQRYATIATLIGTGMAMISLLISILR
ncbi:MAG: SLBB domain-containing protein [Chloroherpetonaceae bacterium]